LPPVFQKHLFLMRLTQKLLSLSGISPCLLPLAFCLFSLAAAAQAPSKTTIKGFITDSTGADIPFATVMLLNPTDSTLLNFSRSDEKGNFMFKNVKNVPYLFKISYVGYLPLQKYVPAAAGEVNDLGTLNIKPINTELMEVVIKAAKATLSIKGDTVEYDASSFKVPPGSTVEDLLRRLPGIEVDAEGNIRAQGRDVKRVYVDGKTFFGDDPKAATKNLGAETLSKIQVYNEKSEQAKLTGVDDGKKEKVMNLELKDEYKKGSFGKVSVAGGTEERWAGRGNYNRFNKKMQFSVLGYGNNINQTGVNWEDYGEFKGQNTFNDNDNGDFGFGNGGRYYWFGGDDSDIPFNNFDGRGFTRNFGAGSNLNYDHKKRKFNASYFYNETDLSLDQFGFRQNFLGQDSSLFNADTTQRGNFRSNHSISTRYEHEMDSSNVLIVKASARIGASSEQNRQSQLFLRSEDVPLNRLSLDNGSDLNTWRLTSSAIFRHRFKKKGRSFALSAGYNGNQSDGTERILSLNQVFQSMTDPSTIRQLNGSDNNTHQWKSSALFTESFSKKWFWETFYNFSRTANGVNRQVADLETSNARVDSLSRFFDNSILYNRFGSSVRYSHSGLNVAVGLAAQQIGLHGEYAVDEGQPLLAAPFDRKYNNLTPNVQFNYEFPNNVWLNLDYNYNVEAPQLSDLQPVPNVNNPAFRTEGNPDLDPARSHAFGININHWNPATFANFGIGTDFSLYDNQIVYNQIVEPLPGGGIRTTTRPVNVSDGQRLNTYLWSNFPLVKTKLTMNLGGNANLSNAPAFVDNKPNETRNRGFNVNLGFNITPSPKLIVDVRGSVGLTRVEYSIDDAQNQNIQNHSARVNAKWQFASKFFLESNFDYNVYRNDRFDFNQGIPIWNASVRHLLTKNNRLELRLAAFDLLNRRQSITQSGSQNFVVRNIATTLARYYMLSATYNLKGFENKIKKNDWW